MDHDHFQAFVTGFTALVERTSDESTVLSGGRDLLADLISQDTWLADRHAVASTERYAQYLLHCDPAERFSVVSFVWGPGQRTPVHNHRVWGLVGVLRGSEETQDYHIHRGRPVPTGPSRTIGPGEVETVSPASDDWHQVTNTSTDISVSIHVYGADIGTVHRRRFDETLGRPVEFVSGYDNEPDSTRED